MKLTFLILFTSLSLFALDKEVTDILEKRCLECHDADLQKGDFRMDSLLKEGVSLDNYKTWQLVHFKLADHSMPPKKKGELNGELREKIMEQLSGSVVHLINRDVKSRSTTRRMNRLEFACTLQDLLGLSHYTEKITSMLPDESKHLGFDKSSKVLTVSPELMSMYHIVIDKIFDELLLLPPDKPEASKTHIQFKVSNLPSPHSSFALINKSVDPTWWPHGKFKHDKPPYATGVALIKKVSETRTGTKRFKYKAPVDGNYKVHVKLWAFKNEEGSLELKDIGHEVPVQVATSRKNSFLLGITNERKYYDFDLWQYKGDTVSFNPIFIDTYKLLPLGEGMAGHLSGDKTKYLSENLDWRIPVKLWSGKAFVLEDMIVEGPFYKKGEFEHYKNLFGELEYKLEKNGYSVISANPQADAEKLIRNFLIRAYRGRLYPSDLSQYNKFFAEQFEKSKDFKTSLVNTYKLILYSPRFFLLDNSSSDDGKLIDKALAVRLSYFLWNSMPDMELLLLARDKMLHKPEILKQQFERMIKDHKFDRFTKSFTDKWLNLDEINTFTPDSNNFKKFSPELDRSYTLESSNFFKYLILKDLPIANLVKSDFTFVNRALAELYGLPLEGIPYHKVVKVMLPESANRGGFLNHAAVMRATANGVDTSPVIRGAFVLRKFFGQEPINPPVVAALEETEISENATIKEKLEKHKTNVTCYNCHKHIDAAGFALEEFDAIGDLRTNYEDHTKSKVDSSAEHLILGKIDNKRDFLNKLAGEKEILARSLLRQFVICATGEELNFADEKVIKKIISQCPEELNVKSLLGKLIGSELFLKK